jgi:hypothetical protein
VIFATATLTPTADKRALQNLEFRTSYSQPTRAFLERLHGPVCQSPIVKHLEQSVENVVVSFLDFAYGNAATNGLPTWGRCAASPRTRRRKFSRKMWKTIRAGRGGRATVRHRFSPFSRLPDRHRLPLS